MIFIPPPTTHPDARNEIVAFVPLLKIIDQIFKEQWHLKEPQE